MLRTYRFQLVVLFTMAVPATQLLGQEGRTVCQQEVLGRIHAQGGQDVAFRQASSFSISSREEGVRGQVVFTRVGRRFEHSYECTINTRSGVVIRASVVGLGGTSGPGGGRPGRGEVYRGTGTANCSVPTLYADDRERGRTYEVASTIQSLHRNGFGDQASSLCVPEGWTMIVFVDDDLRGARLRLNGPDSILDLKRDRPNGMDWGDVISSVEVRERRASGAPRECSDYPYLFDNDGYGGGKQRIDRSVENLHRSGWGDRASSLCVPDRWVVVFYLDSGFRGDRLEIRGPQAIHDLKRDRPQGRDWGDQISSVEIRRSR